MSLRIAVTFAAKRQPPKSHAATRPSEPIKYV
jgi:hypothetical protein